MNNFGLLPTDILLELAVDLDLPNILTWCSLNQRFNNLICKNDIFWMDKFIHDYGNNNKPDNMSWKEFYQGFNAIHTMKYNDTIFRCRTDVEFKKICDKFPIVRNLNLNADYNNFYVTLDIDSKKFVEVFFSQDEIEENSGRYVNILNENDDYEERYKVDFTVDGENPMKSGLIGWISFTIKEERYNPAIESDLYLDPKSSFNQIWTKIEEQILITGTHGEKQFTKENIFSYMQENEIFRIGNDEQTYHLIKIDFNNIYYG